MRKICAILVLSLGLLFESIGGSYGATEIDANFHQNLEKLRRDLFTHYVKTNRPANQTEVIRVSIGLELKHVDLDEVTGLVSVHAVIIVNWKDPKLQWDAKNYGDIDKLHLNGHEIWIPDLSLYNSATNNPLDHYGNGISTLSANGKISWAIKVRLQSFCSMNMKNWPLDTHQCLMKIGSWTYNGYQLDLNYNREITFNTKNIVSSDFVITQSETKKETTFYDCCEEPYVSINYDFNMRRRSAAYRTIFFPMALAVVLMTLSSFWLPPNRGEKLTLNGMNLIVITLNILYFSRNLPTFSLRIPNLVIFYSCTLVLATISTLISIFVISSARCNSKKQLPPGFKKLIKGRLGRWTGVSDGNVKKDQTELRQHFEDGKSADESSLIGNSGGQSDWCRFAKAVDRLTFVVYCVAFVGFICFM